VTGHLREVRATDLYRALGLSAFAVFVRKRSEIPARVLVEFCLELSQPIVIHSVTPVRLHPFGLQFVIPSPKLNRPDTKR
jgi:hypothetical protein